MLRVLFFTTIITVVSSAAFASDSEVVQGKVAEQIVELKEELNLTNEQVEELKPLLEKSVKQQKEVLKKYGIEPGSQNNDKKLSLRQSRKLKSDLKEVRKTTNKEVSAVLSEDQFKQYQVMADERRKQMRAKIKQ